MYDPAKKKIKVVFFSKSIHVHMGKSIHLTNQVYSTVVLILIITAPDKGWALFCMTVSTKLLWKKYTCTYGKNSRDLKKDEMWNLLEIQ